MWFPWPMSRSLNVGKMTKVPWQTRLKPNSKAHKATHPGECFSADLMQSTQDGFYAQLKGKLTTMRYTAATIFNDLVSRLHYIHLMSSLTSQENIEAMKAFEQFAADHCIQIKQYYADIGALLIMHLSNIVPDNIRQFNTVVSMLTFKMALLKEQ